MASHANLCFIYFAQKVSMACRWQRKFWILDRTFGSKLKVKLHKSVGVAKNIKPNHAFNRCVMYPSV